MSPPENNQAPLANLPPVTKNSAATARLGTLALHRKAVEPSAATPLAVRVLAASMEEVGSFSLGATETVALPLPPGRYLVEAISAAGLPVRVPARVAADATSAVEIDSPEAVGAASGRTDRGDNISTTLADPQLEGSASHTRTRRRSRPRGTPAMESTTAAAVLAPPVRLGLWRIADGSWQPASLQLEDGTLRLSDQPGGTRALVLFREDSGTKSLLARTLILPADPAQIGVDAGFDLNVSGRDAATQQSLRYLARGEVAAAAAVLPAAAPSRAAASARSYSRQLVDRAPGAPQELSAEAAANGDVDMLVNRAWELLQGADPSRSEDRGRAPELFLLAARSGLPAFTMGLRRLLDGLRLCGDHPQAARLLRQVEAVANHADWSRLATSFAGLPSSPGMRGAELQGHLRETVTLPGLGEQGLTLSVAEQA